MDGSQYETSVPTHEAPPTTHGAPDPSETPRGGVPPRTLTRERFQPFDPRRKSPIVASVLSLMPGLGQIYVGYYKVGFIHIMVIASVIAVLNTTIAGGAEPLFGLFIPFFWLYNIIDAGRRAALYNLALEGGRAVELPGSIPEPGMGGTLIGGIILIIVGIVFLTNTLFGLSLEWIEAWWPVAPIAVGIYLIGRWMLDRAKVAEPGESSGVESID